MIKKKKICGCCMQNFCLWLRIGLLSDYPSESL